MRIERIKNPSGYGPDIKILTNTNIDGFKLGQFTTVEDTDSIIINGINLKATNTFMLKLNPEYNCEATLTIAMSLVDEMPKIVIDLEKEMIEIKPRDKTLIINIIKQYNNFNIPETYEGRTFPIWKVDYEEGLYFKRDDVRQTFKIKYFIRKDKDSDWELEYSEMCGEFNHASHHAAITLEKLKERWDYVDDLLDVEMFSYNGIMFKKTHYFKDSKSICGDAIDDFYNEYEDDNSIKIDALKNIVFGYKRDCLVISHGKIYLNSKIIMTKRELLENHGIHYYQIEQMYPREIEEKIKELFPEAKSYKSWQCSGKFDRK